MKVGWLTDSLEPPGGAELTQAEFRAAAPVEIVDVLPGQDVEADVYVVHNCMSYPPETVEMLRGKKVYRYHHDVRPQLPIKAGHIFCSPLQRDRMGMKGKCIPPPIPLERFRAASEAAESRSGAVCVASWANPAKAPWRVSEWANGNGGVDFFGEGPYAPAGSVALAYEQVPEVLARYRTFVYLPTVLEPFGRAVVEAWASGCKLVTNGLVGAKYWITEKPEALETAAGDFWEIVLSG